MPNARVKGQNGEREAAAWLSAVTGLDLERNLDQVRSGGGDILGVPGLCIEVKRCETLLLDRWWRQVEQAADERAALPVLMFRRNRERWSFAIPAGLLVIGIQGRLILGEAEMKQWLRHWLR